MVRKWFKFNFKLYCDRRSVSQFVLFSCSFWSGWQDVTFLWVTITFLFFHVGRPLWREDGSVICSAITRVQFQVTLRPTASSSWCWVPNGAHDHILICLFGNYFLSSRCRAPSLISPHEQGDPARRQSQKSKLRWFRGKFNFNLTIGKAAL
jgi:hypothetical protein